MENSQFGTPKPSKTQFTFPPHRRRPLKSKTLCTLVQILSHCYDRSHAHEAVPEDPKLDNRGSELGQVTGRDELVGHNPMESENLLVGKELLVDETRGVMGRDKDNCSTESAQVAGHDELVCRNPSKKFLVGKELLVDENREILGRNKDNSSTELGQVTGHDELVGHNHMESENLLVGKELLVDENGEIIGQDKDNQGVELGQVAVCDELVGPNHMESESLLVGKELLVDDTREVMGQDKDNCSTESAQVAGHDELVGRNQLKNLLVGKELLVDENREIMGCNKDNSSTELGQVTGHDELVGHNHMVSENLLVGEELLVDENGEIMGQDKDNRGVELGQVAVCDELVGPNNTESENLLVGKELLVDENREVMGSQAGGLGNSHMDHNYNNDVVGLIDNQEDQFNFPEFGMEEFGLMGQQELDKELCVPKVCGANDSFDGDMIAGSSKSNENKGKKSPPVESNEGELQSKEKELEKLLSFSGVTDPSHRSNADEEIEEGEISGDAGVYGDLMDFLLEDAVSSEEQSVDKGLSSESIIDKEELTGDELQRRYEKDVQSTPLSVDAVDRVSNSMEDELRESNINLVESKSDLVFPGATVEDKRADGYGCRVETARNKRQVSQARESDSPATSLENLALPGGSVGRNATENNVTAFTQEDAGIKTKKRRRGPQTEEKKEKKKRKERIRRAEKNKRLGVNRLIPRPPILKPKPDTPCRHYVKGRCHEGEKCKFSHDTVPDTKARPCSHFARHACLKGDDCPYDHQLSKYPCNNYLTKGFCKRGAGCLFSHEVPVKEGAPIASSVSKPELKSVSSPSNSTPKQQLKGNDPSHRNINAKSSSIGISPCQSTEQNVSVSIPKPAARAPKGMSFLSNGYLSRGDTSKYKQPGLSPKVDNVAKTCDQTVHSALDLVRNSDEVPKSTPAVAPEGINFLAFGKAPSNDSTKKPYIFPFNRDQGIGKSPLSDSVVNRTPPAEAPQGINSLSFDSTNKKQADPISKEDNAVAVSPSLGKLGDGQSASTPRFSQKLLLSNTPSSVHKALRSTLTFAAKMDRSVGASTEAGSSLGKSTKASTILDFLYGDCKKSKQ